MQREIIEWAGVALVWTIVLVLGSIGALLVYALAIKVGVL